MFSDAKEFLAFMKKEEIEFISVRFTDLAGRWHHFTMPVDGFGMGEFEDGIGLDGSSIQGFQTIEASDLLLYPDPTSAFLDPFCDYKTLVALCDIKHPGTNEPYNKDPRTIARRAEQHLKGSGIADTAYFGPELEFFIFDSVKFNTDPYHFGFSFESSDSHTNPDLPSDGHWIKNKRGYVPVPPSDKHQDIRSLMVKNLEKVGVQVEKHHHEVATAGQAEIDIRFDTLSSIADKVIKFKYTVKNTAVAVGKTVTFMPKPIYGDNGSGMHVHISLWKEEKPLFYGEGYANLSETALQFIAGIFAHADALTAFTNPTVNSYRRLVKGFEAPINLVISESNRSAIIRVPSYALSPKAKHFEYRGPDATANPYLTFSALLLAGMDGIKKKMPAPPSIEKDLFDISEEEAKKIAQIPDSLAGALDSLEKDNQFLLEGGVFSRDLIESYCDIRRKEIALVAQHPNPMEFDLYFDL
jgi:glutamine synthetase